jgi:hypothetical protein
MPAKMYSRDVLEPVVRLSRSFRDLTIRLGKKPHGGLIAHIKKVVVSYGIDTSHFGRFAWNKGLEAIGRKKAQSILVKGKKDVAYRLRRSLLEIGREWCCGVCGIKEWRSGEIDLEVDHIDGDKTNNMSENLRFICPNCHSQTKNFRFKGRKHGRAA